ncbi:LLM class flavin-dependent oxidoreductase [Phytohabitans sp. ZYX-F-186]|uniref:LLM class flavin-dependent oxidoreductase n=1 Tax=Phytohabitans maris TaxID=3071409 RepID=A0ABU0ZQE8_9ACTN|nr:LLM class flavin-dependent oxidoreductase [Phytohabitans sp. ZYX-F-186]MDQ7909251.1 LLM class flavin-dependent oxidoreductase [Phytohabitans sp. ZYX-F-186]
MTTLGAVYLPQFPPERLRSVARAADEAGLEELWLWEDCFLQGGIASMAATLGWTERLRVGVGLLPVPLRNVALTAMEMAALNRFFPGRAVVGIGHGVQSWMGQVGARVESPVTLLREYADALRALLSGERVTTKGRYVSLDGVRLDWPPAAPPPIFAGATGPRSLRLCGEIADGTIVTGGNSPDELRAARALVDEGRARRSTGAGDPHTTVVYVHAATGPSAAERLDGERRKWGYDTIEGRSIAGGAEQFAEAIQRWVEAGADTVVLQPTPDEPDLEGFVRFVAQEVRPLVP